MRERRVARGWCGCVCNLRGNFDNIVGVIFVMASVGYSLPKRDKGRDWREKGRVMARDGSVLSMLE